MAEIKKASEELRKKQIEKKEGVEEKEEEKEKENGKEKDEKKIEEMIEEEEKEEIEKRSEIEEKREKGEQLEQIEQIELAESFPIESFPEASIEGGIKNLETIASEASTSTLTKEGEEKSEKIENENQRTRAYEISRYSIYEKIDFGKEIQIKLDKLDKDETKDILRKSFEKIKGIELKISQPTEAETIKVEEIERVEMPLQLDFQIELKYKDYEKYEKKKPSVELEKVKKYEEQI